MRSSNKRSTPSSASRSRTRKVILDDSSSDDDHVSNETVHLEEGQLSSSDLEASAKDASKSKKRVTKKGPKKLGKKSSLRKVSKKMKTDDDETTSHHSTLTSSSRNKEDNMKGFELFLKYEQFKKANPNFLNMLESFPTMDSSKKSPSRITNERKSRDLAVPPRNILFNDETIPTSMNSSNKSSIRKSHDRNNRESVHTLFDYPDEKKPSAKSPGRNRLSFDDVVSNERDHIPKKKYVSREHKFLSKDDPTEKLYAPRNSRYSREKHSIDNEVSYGEDKSPQPYGSRNPRGYSNVSYSNEKESLYGSKIPLKSYAGRNTHAYSHDEFDEHEYKRIDHRRKNLDERNRYSFYGPNRTSTKSLKSSFSSNMYYSNTAEMIFNNYRNSSTRIDEYYAEKINSEKCETMLNHSHLHMSTFEPRVFFNQAMRLEYMTYCVIGYNKHNDLRDDSKEFYESFAKTLVTELDHGFDSYDSFEINNFDCKKFLLETLQFNISAYNQLPGTSVKYLYQCIRDYLYSRRDGIAVVKVEKSTYDYYAKLRLEFGYYPEATRAYFTISDQKERMNFIIIQHIVYQPIPYARRQYWLDFSNTVLNACEHICRSYKDSGTASNDIFPLESEIEAKLRQVHFPLEEYSNETFTDKKFFIKHLQDFVYCLANDIEEFKLWNFTPKNELIEDYLNYQGWFKQTEDEMNSDDVQPPDTSNIDHSENINDSNGDHENVINSDNENVNNNDNKIVNNYVNEMHDNNDNVSVNSYENDNENLNDNKDKDFCKTKVCNTDNNEEINVENTDRSNVDLVAISQKEKTSSENNTRKKIDEVIDVIDDDDVVMVDNPRSSLGSQKSTSNSKIGN